MGTKFKLAGNDLINVFTTIIVDFRLSLKKILVFLWRLNL